MPALRSSITYVRVCVWNRRPWHGLTMWHDHLQFTERTPGSFVEERDASIVWRYFSGDEAIDAGDRAWARRQAAEAQNHIFDRSVTLTFPLLRWLRRVGVVWESVMACASYLERMPSLSYQTISHGRQRSERFCMLVARLTLRDHLGSFLRRVRASHIQKTLCSLSVAMKSCYVGLAN